MAAFLVAVMVSDSEMAEPLRTAIQNLANTYPQADEPHGGGQVVIFAESEANIVEISMVKRLLSDNARWALKSDIEFLLSQPEFVGGISSLVFMKHECNHDYPILGSRCEWVTM